MNPVKPTPSKRRLDVWVSEELHYELRTRFSEAVLNHTAGASLVALLNRRVREDADDALHSEAFDWAAEREAEA